MTIKMECPVKVGTTSEFQRQIKALKKKYRKINKDILPIITQLKEGSLPGDQVSDTEDFTVFKVRVKNSDINKGLSAGYRLIYYVKTEDKILLLNIYSKSQQENIPTHKILQIIKSYEG